MTLAGVFEPVTQAQDEAESGRALDNLPVEPDRKKDFNCWLDFHEDEIRADYFKLTNREFLPKWHISSNRAVQVRKRLNLYKGRGGKTAQKSGIAPNPKDKPGVLEDGIYVSRRILEEKMAELDTMTDRLEEVNRVIDERTPRLPTLPEFDKVPDDCKAKWFEIYGKLVGEKW